MPKGAREGGHEGRGRQCTSPEEIDAQLQAERQNANVSCPFLKQEEDEQEEGGDGASGDPKKEKSLGSDNSEDGDGDYQQKRKGVEGLLDIEYHNRVAQTTKKVTQLDLDGPKELSRREREEIEKQKTKEQYTKMPLAGRTERPRLISPGWQSSGNSRRRQQARKKKAKEDTTLSEK